MNHQTNALPDSIAQFFHLLEQETAEGNFTALAERFSETFLAASPYGAKIAQRSSFLQGLPERKKFFDKFRARPARLVALEATALDARYTLAKSRWLLTFARDGQEPQEVFADSTYIVDTGEDPYRIILYLTSQDLPKVLAERGLLPS